MKKRILVIGIVVVLVFFAGFLSMRFWPPASMNLPRKISRLIFQDTVRSKLDGLLKNPETLDGRIYAVMVDNHSFGRPYQTGLSSASVVYEALAEGGITRIMALFEGPVASKVGPARSVRPYFLDFAVPYMPVLIHVGGSDEALGNVRRETSVLDIDGMRYEGIEDYFVRDKKIEKPHNDFVNLAAIQRLAMQANFTSTTTGFEFDSDIPDGVESAKEAPQEISLDFSFPQYAVQFVYEPALAFYRRYVGGQPHKDTASQSQLTASNVIVLFMAYYPIDDIGRLKMRTTGSGKAWFFRDGKKFLGTWKREQKGALQFFDQSGKIWKLKPGVTWIEVIDKA